jgi:transcriptional regulator with XRE-family HTH domain
LVLGLAVWGAAQTVPLHDPRPPVIGTLARAMAEHRVQSRWWEALGRWLGKSAPAGTTLAIGPAGALPYASGLRTFDMYGLCSHVASRGEGQVGHRLWGLSEAAAAGSTLLYPGRCRASPTTPGRSPRELRDAPAPGATGSTSCHRPSTLDPGRRLGSACRRRRPVGGPDNDDDPRDACRMGAGLDKPAFPTYDDNHGGQVTTRELGAALRESRQRLGLSQQALAERAGVSRNFVAQIERGESVPTVVTLGRLAAALGVGIAGLLGEEATNVSAADAVAVPLVADRIAAGPPLYLADHMDRLEALPRTLLRSVGVDPEQAVLVRLGATRTRWPTRSYRADAAGRPHAGAT